MGELKAEKKEKYEDYELDGFVNTLIRAEEIKQDAELMKLIAPRLDKTAKAAINAAEILYGKSERENNENQSN